ncbi:MAG: hypothetical protein IT458_06155 [Planctomycetes bacterium]|nr:hypothetical protein [Planctomycetota bacterium]
MSRERDLFKILQDRRAGGASPSAPDRDAGEPEGRDGVAGLLDRVAAFFAPATQAGRTSRHRGGNGPAKVSSRPLPPAPHRFLVSGTSLAAVVLAALTLGFVGGRLLAPSGGGKEVLAAPRGENRMQAAVPPTVLTEAQEEETLANEFFVVLMFRASQRATAAKVADHLVREGVSSARIRKIPSRQDPSEHYWCTVVYVADPAGKSEILERLSAAAAPGFVQGYTEAIAALKANPKLYHAAPKG